LLLAPVDLSEERLSNDQLQERCQTAARNAYADREALFGPEQMREIERWILLRVIDEKWRDHLYEIDQLRAGIGLRAYGQKDPLLEYKREAFEMFEELMGNIDADTVRYLFRVMPARPAQAPAPAKAEAAAATKGSEDGGAPATSAPAPRRAPEPAEAVVVGGGLAARPVGALRENKPGPSVVGGPRASAPPVAEAVPQTFVRDQPKVGRNDPCPCGSGKKYKKCHGAGA
jgi:preprotein translocase subunit SecA